MLFVDMVSVCVMGTCISVGWLGRDTRGKGGGFVLTSSDVTLASSSDSVYECELQLEHDEHSDSGIRRNQLLNARRLKCRLD